MSDNLLSGFTIGAYRALPRQNRLEGRGGVHHVEPKVMAVLLALAARPGELVPRQTLLDEVWGDVVVLDETLTKAIQVLRGYFDDKPSSPEYIRTVPRQGYELIARIGMLDEAAIVNPDNSNSEPHLEPQIVEHGQGARSANSHLTRSPRRLLWLIAAAGGLVVLMALAISRLPADFAQETITLAVIPPVASGDTSDLGFVGEGLADFLIDQLSRAEKLQVVARRSSFGIRDTDANVRVIGEQLGAHYLVEGSLRQDRNGLLLTLFLVDTDTGTNVWTTQIRGAVDDVSQLQIRSIEQLRLALRRNLGIEVEAFIAPRPQISELAYRKYLEARYQWTLRGEPRIGRSVELLQEALAIAPDYAAAHLALAQSVAVRPFYTDQPVASQFELARYSAKRALALDPGMAADVAALEGFMLFKERRWSEAQASLLRALDLAPDNLNALYWYSWFLSHIGRYQEALSYLLLAQKLDPVSAVLNDRLAIAYVWIGDMEKAAQRYRVAMNLGYLESNQPLSMMMFLYRAGRFSELTELLLRLGGNPNWVLPTVSALENVAEREATSVFIDSVVVPDPVLEMVRFGIWMLFGQTERAFRDFDPGLKSPYVEALWSTEAAHLRADPRFERLLASLGFSGEERDLLPSD